LVFHEYPQKIFLHFIQQENEKEEPAQGKKQRKKRYSFSVFSTWQGFFTKDLMQATDNFAGANENCC